jgi:hypothetical protein
MRRLRLARSLLDLPRTELLQQDWGITDINVYGSKQRACMVLDVRNPYLSLAVPRPQTQSDRREAQTEHTSTRDGGFNAPPSRQEDVFHRFPHALGLGIVLMQILLSEKLDFIESGRQADARSPRWSPCEDIKENLNYKWHQAVLLKQECQKQFPSMSPPLNAIYECTNLQPFLPPVPPGTIPSVLRETSQGCQLGHRVRHQRYQDCELLGRQKRRRDRRGAEAARNSRMARFREPR